MTSFIDWRPPDTRYSDYAHDYWTSPYYEDDTERQIQIDPFFEVSVAERVRISFHILITGRTVETH